MMSTWEGLEGQIDKVFVGLIDKSYWQGMRSKVVLIFDNNSLEITTIEGKEDESRGLNYVVGQRSICVTVTELYRSL